MSLISRLKWLFAHETSLKSVNLLYDNFFVIYLLMVFFFSFFFSFHLLQVSGQSGEAISIGKMIKGIHYTNTVP